MDLVCSVILAIFAMDFWSSPTLWKKAFGVWCMFLSIRGAISFGISKGAKGKLTMLSEDDLEVGKVYKKKGDLFIDDRMMPVGGEGVVTGGQYLTKLNDIEGNELFVSFKQSAYAAFVVTGDKNNRYRYVESLAKEV